MAERQSFRITTPSGRLSTRQFRTRAAARQFTTAHPGYKRLEYPRRLGPVPPPRGERATLRGHAPLPKLPGGFSEKDVFRGGMRLRSVNQMLRFVAFSNAPCFYDDVLLGGDARPATREGEGELGRIQDYNRQLERTIKPTRVLLTMPGASRALDRTELEQILVEETSLIEVVRRLRPDIDIGPGVHVYGWTLREGTC